METIMMIIIVLFLLFFGVKIFDKFIDLVFSAISILLRMTIITGFIILILYLLGYVKI